METVRKRQSMFDNKSGFSTELAQLTMSSTIDSIPVLIVSNYREHNGSQIVDRNKTVISLNITDLHEDISQITNMLKKDELNSKFTNLVDKKFRNSSEENSNVTIINKREYVYYYSQIEDSIYLTFHLQNVQFVDNPKESIPFQKDAVKICKMFKVVKDKMVKILDSKKEKLKKLKEVESEAAASVPGGSIYEG